MLLIRLLYGFFILVDVSSVDSITESGFTTMSEEEVNASDSKISFEVLSIGDGADKGITYS